MAKALDDLEAVRTVTGALGGFGAEDQERIIRWAREKLGLLPAQHDLETRFPQAAPAQPTRVFEPGPPAPTTSSSSAKDLKSFVLAKGPKSDVHFAATVAYFYRFEAPPDQRKNEIDRTLLQDACRLAGRERLKNPGVTLNNAKMLGLLDSGSEAGKFAVNTVGENLVAMTLPSRPEGSPNPRSKRKSHRPVKRAANKKK